MNLANSSQHANSNFFVALLVSGLALFLLFALMLGIYEVATGGPSDGLGFELTIIYGPAWLVAWLTLATYYSKSLRVRTLIQKAILLVIAIIMIMATVNRLSS